jgi:multicomponent K+:H+ antiporter subunit D
MMLQLPVLPIVLPLMAGALLLLLRGASIEIRRGVAGIALLATLWCGLTLGAQTADGSVLAYLLGNWRAPFGIALAADRLAAVMLVLTALVAILCLVAAMDGEDTKGPHFHALLCFQVMGLSGAFLTADLFNLFVFFEVLLISSYALLLHGADGARLRAATHYVVVNLIGSALFLVAVSLLYGITGTLNMADLALRLAQVTPPDVPLVHSAALILLVVFALKAAMLPLYLWLPGTYRAASAPVAALFAIMTKVGVYSIVRVFTLFDSGSASTGGAPALFSAIDPWLFPLGLATLALAGVAAVAARDLRALAAALVIGSAGTLLATIGIGTAESSAAALFYLAHSTLAGGAAFLLVGIIRAARGTTGDDLSVGPAIAGAGALGALYFATSLTLSGLPPMSGFIAKVGILSTSAAAGVAPWVWTVVLGAGLLSIIALARAGSLVFWRPQHVPGAHDDHAAHTPQLPRETTNGICGAMRASTLALAFALLLGAMLVVFAAPAQKHFAAIAGDLYAPKAYIEAVLRAEPQRKHTLIAPAAEDNP